MCASTTLGSKICEWQQWKRGPDGWAYPPSSGRVSTQTSRPSPAMANPSAVLPAAETTAALIGDSQDPYGAVDFPVAPEAARGCIAAVRSRSSGRRVGGVDEREARGRRDGDWDWECLLLGGAMQVSVLTGQSQMLFLYCLVRMVILPR
jgi:hypothetical protein